MISYFSSNIVRDVDFVDIYRHGDISNVDGLRNASVLSYDFVRFDVESLRHGTLFLSF